MNNIDNNCDKNGRYMRLWIVHFNTRVKRSDRNCLTRENYCIPTKEIDYWEKRFLKRVKELIKINGKPPQYCSPLYYKFPNKLYEDEEHYAEEFVKSHYEDCMKNFDLNMSYFQSLDYDEFNEYLTNFVKKNNFIEITDLGEVRDKIGVYILVLDKYKQVYIGIATSQNGIKGRILQHWSKRKEFGRLLYGTVENSILSIDSFGALDTTRIFYREIKDYQDISEQEYSLVEEFKSEYRLNRTAGGLNAENDDLMRNIQLVASMQTRELV